MKRQSRKLLSVVVAAILVTSMVGVGAADSTVSSTEQTYTNSETEVSTSIEVTTVAPLEDTRADAGTDINLPWDIESFLSELFTDNPDLPSEPDGEDDSPPADAGDDTGAQDGDEDTDGEDSSGVDESDSERPQEDSTDGTGVDDGTDGGADETEDAAPVPDGSDSSDGEPEDDGPNSEETDASDGDLDRDAVERYAHEAVNEERAARGLDELEFDTDLRDIARSHSQDMAERGYFSHRDPDGNGFADRYDEAGYAYRTGGENIAQTWYDRPVRTDAGTVHYEDERELGYGLIDQWMNSEGHMENILTDRWENEGIGVYVTEDGQVYATQNFS